MTGTEFSNAIQSLSPDDREKLILSLFSTGDVPNFIKKDEWRPVILSLMINAKKYTLSIYISPFLAVGTDADPFYIPMRPETAQEIANQYKSHILSKKLVRDAFSSAPGKIPLQIPQNWNGKKLIIPGNLTYTDMTKPTAFSAANQLIVQASKGNLPRDVAGHSKSVVVGPGLDGSKVAIYGGYNPAGGVDGWAWQSYPGPHEASWVDYSQRIQLVFGRGFLDGKEVAIRDIFLDSVLSVLVSDQGAFDPKFPSKFSPVSTPPKIPPTTPPKPTPGTPPISVKPPIAENPPIARTESKNVIVFGSLALAGLLTYVATRK